MMFEALRARSLGLVAAILSLSLVACGGGSSDGESSGNDNAEGPPVTQEPAPGAVESTLSGVIVVPDGAQVNQAERVQASRALARPREVAPTNAGCTNVPTGYAPVANAAITFWTQDDQVSGITAQTDQCGEFSASVPGNIAYVAAAADGYKEIKVPVEVFGADANGTPSALSVLPDTPGAGYEIASLQWENNRLYFSIVDTITNKAVLGVPQTAITYRVNQGGSNGVASLSYAALQQGGDASIVLALDASGSMGYNFVLDSQGQIVLDENGKELTYFRMAARAAHTFLDGKRDTDEVGFVIFDGSVDWIDAEFFDRYIMVADVGQGVATYQPPYDVSGFSTTTSDLRLAVDFYNNRSVLWSASTLTFDPLHEDLPATLGFPGYVSYPWGGLTAAYSAADLARQKVLDRDNARKVVVLMSDGEDNSSRVTVNQLIENFKQANIPLWTVEFGDSFSTHDLENLADETGGQFILAANESQLQEKFAAIQTGIVFQYIAELQSATLPSNAQLELTLDFGSAEVTRMLSIQ